MVELHQSCGSLVVSASTACCGGNGNGNGRGVEHDGKREATTNHHHHVDVINDEISAELQRERQRNAELMEKISMLEAQLRERDKYNSLQLPYGQILRKEVHEQIMKNGKAKRQKVATINSLKIDEDKDMTADLHHDKCIPGKGKNAENRLVNWMNIDDTELSLHSEILKGRDSATDDGNDENDDDEVVSENHICSNHDITKDADVDSQLSSPGARRDVVLCNQSPAEESINPSTDEKRKCTEHHDRSRNHHIRGAEIKFERAVQNVFSSHKKHPKIAFCPKEVKRIIDSKELLLKNAQSHTIRKIVVFASLGIRHGCEDLYELDFSHFAILRKGEPFISSKDPGEHVLYENPDVRRKIFYPNHQNPTLCPVKILEEEKSMRPSDASCPSFLFLCIKYGGRTRNIPQNEYVRQRMGRNKLKSFGLAICRMAMLVHIRSGSFFFKALGITLLFMAGFPDDLVQRETKYRNLDLLQKYYRTDEDAEGEELFLSHPATADPDAIPIPGRVMVKKMSTKSKSRGQKKVDIKDEEKTSFLQSAPSSSELAPKFELLRNASIQTPATAPAHCMTFQEQVNRSIPNPLFTSINCNILNSNQQYPIFSQHSTSSLLPLTYWLPPNTFLPYLHPSSHTYPCPMAGNYLSSYPQPYYGHPSCNTLAPKPTKQSWKEDAAASVAGNDSKSICSSSTEATKVEK